MRTCVRALRTWYVWLARALRTYVQSSPASIRDMHTLVLTYEVGTYQRTYQKRPPTRTGQAPDSLARLEGIPSYGAPAAAYEGAMLGFSTAFTGLGRLVG